MQIAYSAILILTFLISFLTFSNRNVPKHIRALFWLMLITCFIEFGNQFTVLPYAYNANHWTYNLHSLFEFYFFCYFFYRIFQNKINQKFIIWSALLYSLTLAVAFSTYQKWYEFHVHTYIFSLFLLIAFCLLYFRELYLEDAYKKLSGLPEFWIVTGFILFCSGFLPYMVLLHYLNTYYIEVSLFFRDYVLATLNLLLYTFFSMGLLCSYWTKK